MTGQKGWHWKRLFWQRNNMIRRKRGNKFSRSKLLFLLILSAALLIFLGAKFLVVRKVEVLGNAGCLGDSKILGIEKMVGQNLLTVGRENLKENITKKYPCIRQVRVDKIFPDKIKVEIIGREPKAVVLITGSLRPQGGLLDQATDSAKPVLDLADIASAGAVPAFLVDDDGVIFSAGQKEGLPKIYSSLDLRLGQRIQDNLMVKILKIIDKIKIVGLDANSSALSADWSYLVYSKPAVYFNLKSNLDFQLASLQLILKEAKIVNGTVPLDGIDKDVTFVDLRFDKPIVRFAPKKIER